MRTADELRAAHRAFDRIRKVEEQYAIKLRKIAKHIAEILRAFDPSDSLSGGIIRAALERYSQALDPWAKSVAARFMAEIAQKELRAWRQLTQAMGIALRKEITEAPIGKVTQQLIADQVHLIKSLPLEAGQRVQEMATKALYDGTRAESMVEEIMKIGNVTRARATLIARTETARATTMLTKARAESAGLDSYIWRTARDNRVRPSHRALEGTVHKWASPPLSDPPNHHAHPGCIWNCRCVAEPIIPD